MAIEGYRTIPTHGSGELYSWPGCVVLVSANWREGPAFAEQVVATDHDDAATAFRGLAGWLLANAGDTEADFAAVLQTGSSLLCMAAGQAEVMLGDGRKVASDTSGMWAQLVVPGRPDRIELGVSAGVAPDRIDLGHGVVEASGALLVPDAASTGGSSDVGSEAVASVDEAAAAPSGAAAAGSVPPAEAAVGDGPSTSAEPRVGGVSRPGRGSGPATAVGAGGDSDDTEAAERSGDGSGGSTGAAGFEPHRAAADEVAAPDDGPIEETLDRRDEVGRASAGDPRGSPDGQGGHELPFDDEHDGGPPTDADGLIGIVSEEPEPSGASGSDTDAAARPAGDVGAASGAEATPEPTGEHRTASSFEEDQEPDRHDSGSAADEARPPGKGEATGLVPIVTTPEVSGASPFEPAAGRQPAAAPVAGSEPAPDEGEWPPPPAWATGAADAGTEADGEAWDDAWDSEAAADSEVGMADADLVTGEATGSHGAMVPEAPPAEEDDDKPAGASGGDDTNEAAWAGGLDDDQSIPLLLFDDGVAVELPGDVLIGRRPDPGVRDDPSRLHTLTMTDDSQAVSRNHVELRRREDEVSILDCGSANGTFVEATPGELTKLDPEAPHLLRDGERVVFGKRWFEYRAPRAGEPEA
ncbi:MAG: FHA domain-containing protein [Microthrixaceae bacterium]